MVYFIAEDKIAIVTTAPTPVTEITQNHKDYDGLCIKQGPAWRILSDTYD